MATIGIDDLTGMGTVPRAVSDNQRLVDNAAYTHTLNVGEKITELGYYCGDDGGNQIEVGIRDITAGSNNAALITSVTLTSTGVLGDRVSQAIAEIGTAGNTYAVAFRVVSASAEIYSTYTGNVTNLSSTDGSIPLEPTFTPSGSTENDKFAVFATTSVSGGGDTESPTISSAALSADGGTVTINFDENVTVGAGGNSGFTVNATYGTVTLTPTTALPAQSVAFTCSRPIENGETISGSYVQPEDGFEDAAGNYLASGSFAITNTSKVHKLFSDVAKTTAYTAGDVRLTVLSLTDSTVAHTENLTPDLEGYIQSSDALTTGDYIAVVRSDDRALHNSLDHIVP